MQKLIMKTKNDKSRFVSVLVRGCVGVFLSIDQRTNRPTD
jgi:hypothetical protein